MQLLRMLVLMQKHEHEIIASSAKLCFIELGVEAFVGGEWMSILQKENGCPSYSKITTVPETNFPLCASLSNLARGCENEDEWNTLFQDGRSSIC